MITKLGGFLYRFKPGTCTNRASTARDKKTAIRQREFLPKRKPYCGGNEVQSVRNLSRNSGHLALK